MTSTRSWRLTAMVGEADHLWTPHPRRTRTAAPNNNAGLIRTDRVIASPVFEDPSCKLYRGCAYQEDHAGKAESTNPRMEYRAFPSFMVGMCRVSCGDIAAGGGGAELRRLVGAERGGALHIPHGAGPA